MALTSLTATINNGTKHSFDLTKTDEEGYYYITLPAGSASSFLAEGGYFPVSLEATDDANLSTPIDSKDVVWGSNLKLFVYEENKPTITITSPTDGSYLISDTKPTITFDISDNKYQTEGFSGIDTSSIVLKLNNNTIPQSKINIILDENGGVCHCSYVPEEDLTTGVYEIRVDAKDNDNNAAATATFSFEIDIQKPGLSVSSPSNNTVTGNSTIAVVGVAEDKNGPVQITIMVNNREQACFDVNTADGSFSREITLSGGNNVIVVTATDKLGNVETSQTINVKYNSTKPSFTDVQILYNNTQVSASHKVPGTGSYLIRCKVTTAT